MLRITPQIQSLGVEKVTLYKNIVSFALTFLMSFCIAMPSIAGSIDAVPLNEKLVDPNVVFVSSGSSLDERYTHYRVILNVMEIYSVIVIEKVMPENEEQEPKIFWSRYLGKGFGNRFVSPNDFVESFKWISADSFSFRNNGKNYQVENIGDVKPFIKEFK